MKTIIRRLKLGEADLYRKTRLAALKDAPYAFSSSYENTLKRSPDSWIEQADESTNGSDKATFIVFSDDKPIGMAALYRIEKQANTGELLQVWIDANYRGSGIAKQLMDEIFNWAGKNNFNKIIAGVTKPNPRAIQFYINYGFSIADNPIQRESGGTIMQMEVIKSQI